MNNGFGNSGGCGNGPLTRGRRLYAINQHDTAMATATNANKAVNINEMMNPIMETQISSTCCRSGAENNLLLSLKKRSTGFKYLKRLSIY